MLRSSQRTPRGGALLIALMVVVVLTGLCYAMLVTTTASVQGTEITLRRTRAFYAAQAGVEDAKQYLKRYTVNIALAQPFGDLDGLAGQTIVNERQLSTDVAEDARYTVRVVGVDTIHNYIRDVRIESEGWVSDGGGRVRRTVRATLRLELGRSEVFDYVYFINNWGWYYGDNIVADGNVRSNGQFDGGNYRAEMNCHPRFKKLVNGTDLQDKLDDGGLYAGWGLEGTDRMRGDVNATWSQNDFVQGLCPESAIGKPRYQHPYADKIEMPNLTDLGMYEELARDFGSYIKVGNKKICDGVLGDDPGEKQNLYLEGTHQEPIEIHGPVVIRGNVVISGEVKGKGSIYCANNIYIPENLQYRRGCTYIPTNPDEAKMETWLEQNQDADALGLFAREHVVIGDYTESQWQSNVSRWVNDSRNESGEDCGEDQLPNTRAGKDGIMGTADDDIFENDGDWTVERYTQEHADAGLLPPGMNVGDPIPGSGEDTDGDGQYDDTTRMSEFSLPDRFITADDWDGNVPEDGIDYADAAFFFNDTATTEIYTNHTIAMLTTDRNNELRFNGCLVSRNEAIIYGTRRLVMNYDYRLLDDGSNYHMYLPRTWNAIEVVMWQSD